jgi:ubiquinone/menaquinone biosynthesis C-methylase UbiE
VKKYFIDLPAWDSERDTLDEFLQTLNRDQRTDIPKLIPIEGMTVLDAGCGDGRITQELARGGTASVVAVDLSPCVLHSTRKRLSECNTSTHLIQSDIENLPFRTGSIDTITCIDTLVHIPDSRKVFTDFSNVLKPGSMVAVNVTNKNPLWRIQGRKRFTPIKYLKDLFLYNFPRALVNITLRLLGRKMIGRHMSEKEFRAIIENEFTVENMLRYGCPPVYFLAIAKRRD